MKKNDWILLLSVATYSFLFYEQTAGINFLLFTIVLIAGLLIRNKEILTNRSWQLIALGSLLSGVCVACYGNALSVIANIISLSILSGISLRTKPTVILSLLFSIYSYITAPVFIFLDRIEKKKTSDTVPNKLYRHIGLIAIPVAITLIFFFIYRASNPLFAELSDKINFDFISWDWVFFTLGGFLLLYGFFYHKKIKEIFLLDENAANNLSVTTTETTIIFGKEISISEENFSGIILFSLLNILLLIVNSLDINFLFIDGKLPPNITYAQFVHEGIGAIIISVITAIAIILFYFRGSVNFYKKNKAIKVLAYCWIVQNAFMLIATISKNNLYVSQYGLTYKRIGVYIYLLLTIIGLITTFIKILQVKTNNFLFRINGWLFYSVLIISSFISWDRCITFYNINRSKYLEKSYLLNLSDSNLPQLFEMKNTAAAKARVIVSNDETDSLQTETDFGNALNKKLYTYLQTYDSIGWRSWYYDDTRIYNRLTKAAVFNKINDLDLSNTTDYDTTTLLHFTSLTNLKLSNCNITTIGFLKNNTKLEYLDLTGNTINDFSALYGLKQLKELYVSDITRTNYQLLVSNLPKTKINFQ
ncbi:MAG TPA: DUF4153 domain-containing protein [Ferruginibacter sp.]|nr:DUF4153 domain-containing protein [Ferruginibacter sp.]